MDGSGGARSSWGCLCACELRKVLVLFLSPLNFQWLRQVPETLPASVGIAACSAASIEIPIVCEVRGFPLLALTCRASFLSSSKAHKLPPTFPEGPSSLELKL